MITIGSATGLTSTVKSSAYTALGGDLVMANAAAGGFTVTLPAAPAPNTTVGVKKTDTGLNAVTVVGSGVTTIDGDASCALLSPGSGAVFQFDGTNWQVRSTANVNYGTDSLQNLWVPAYTAATYYDRRTQSMLPSQLISATNMVAINTVAYLPVYCHRAVVIDQVAILTGSTAPTSGATVRVGLYTATAAGLPGARVYDWATVAPTVASTFYTLAAAGTLPKGWSFFALGFSSTPTNTLYEVDHRYAGPTILAGNTSAMLVPAVQQYGAGTYGYTESVLNGTFNGTPGTLNPVYPSSGPYTPNVWFRVVS